ncbi:MULTISPECIES: hypothetical protein [Methylotenera]|uniref:hypothetical protein n=1 Tax=Methylotenera TaxID=359407 RepID=UPI001E5BDEDD|nr:MULTISPECIES: hypothetical protein [Methylotenera]
MIYLIRFVVCLLCLVSHAAWAGRPFFTDDAALTTPQTCQIETWMQFNANHDRDLWALPACNPTGNFEVTLGINQLQTHANNNVDSYMLQGKTLFRELQTNSWGAGVAFGIIRPRHGDAGADFIYVPYSMSFADDTLIVHANLGWIKNRASSFNRTTWGLGAEYSLVNRVSVFAEAFGDDVVRPIIHTGLNIALIPNKLNLNITGGRDLAVDQDHNFYSIGLNVYGLPSVQF